MPTPPERLPDRAPAFHKEYFLGGSRAPAVDARAGAGAAASEAVLPWPPVSPDLPWRPKSQALPWMPELPDPPWVPERAPP